MALFENHTRRMLAAGGRALGFSPRLELTGSDHSSMMAGAGDRTEAPGRLV